MSNVTHFHIVQPLRVALAATAVVALALPAHAADLATKAYNWTGLYGGANFGFAFNTERATAPLGTASTDPSGVLGGGQLGYDFQFAPSWLAGTEAEFDGTTARSTTSVVGVGVQMETALSIASDHNWYGTLNGRFGYVAGPWLTFAKGGAAWMNANYQVEVNSGIAGVSSLNTTRTGWTAGGGAEYQPIPKWTVKVEYDCLDFGASTSNFAAPAGATTFKTQVNEVKAGINDHFGDL